VSGRRREGDYASRRRVEGKRPKEADGEAAGGRQSMREGHMRRGRRGRQSRAESARRMAAAGRQAGARQENRTIRRER